MASAATIFQQTLNTPRTSVAQFVGKVSSALNVTLMNTPTLVPQPSKGIGSALSFELTNRYNVFAYVALIKPSSKKPTRNGNFGPLKITWNDGNVTHTHFIGWNGNRPLDGYGSELPFPGNVVGAKGATAAGHVSFVAAPGTAITVTSPYSGDGQYTVNLSLETF